MDVLVTAWWAALCGAAVLNVGLWLFSAKRFQAKALADPSYARARRWHLWLSAIYVLVCGFRGIFPRADVQRICLVDGWISSVALGRSVATVAELACVVQWSLLAHEYGRATKDPVVVGIGKAIVPLIVFAECCSWYSVLTTNYVGNSIEESSWTLMAGMLGVAMVRLQRSEARVELTPHLTTGLVGVVAYITFMLLVDVRMYVTRLIADTASSARYLTLAEGWRDINERWVVTHAWADWAPEIAWMTLYFTGAVWVMVSLTHAPRLRGST
ncbi:MAG: hypothetical protein SFW67_12340 [Myxococcaceae bacterium]|nr:hypothetical protein [Myxococcaceae bacterium]